jgi:hypothetical protein
MAVNDLVFRDLGHGLVVLTLLTAIRKLKFSTQQERFAVAETLRDVADEVEQPARVPVR